MIKKKGKGFTLVELIVVIAVIGILVLLATPKFMGYTKKATLTEIKGTIKELENASERYYITTQEWPRLSDEHYTAEELEKYADEFFNRTGVRVELDMDGKYYDIDYDELKRYVQKPQDGFHYIIQNPVGDVFYMDGQIPENERKTPTIKDKNKENNKAPDNISFTGLPESVFEDDNEEEIPIDTPVTIMWSGYLVDRVLNVDISATTVGNGAYFAIKDADGNDLEFFDTNGVQMNSKALSTNYNRFGIVVPEGATSIYIHNGSKGLSVKSIYMSKDIKVTQPVTNIETVPHKTSMDLTWINPTDDDFKQVYILRNGRIVGKSTTGTFADIGLSADTEYKYTLVALDETGNFSKREHITVKTLLRDINWFGINSPNAFDGYQSTTVSIKSPTLTWEGNLRNKVVRFDISATTVGSGAYVVIKDANGNNLEFFDTTGVQMTSKALPNNSNTFSLVIPEGATSIYINNGSKGLTVRDITELDDMIATGTVSNITTKPNKTSMTLSWTNPTDIDFSQVYILRNGDIVGKSTNGTFTDIGLYANTEYTYTLIALDKTGNFSENMIVKAITLPREIVWSGINSPNAFDGYESTTISISSPTLTWEGDLINKSVYFNISATTVGSGAYVAIKNSNGEILVQKSLPNNNNTFSLVIPEGATSIYINNGSKGLTVRDIYETSLK